jgi:hypothetical protein
VRQSTRAGSEARDQPCCASFSRQGVCSVCGRACARSACSTLVATHEIGSRAYTLEKETGPFCVGVSGKSDWPVRQFSSCSTHICHMQNRRGADLSVKGQRRAPCSSLTAHPKAYSEPAAPLRGWRTERRGPRGRLHRPTQVLQRQTQRCRTRRQRQAPAPSEAEAPSEAAAPASHRGCSVGTLRSHVMRWMRASACKQPS